MNLKGRTLLVSDKTDEERDAVASAWHEVGGDVLRLARFWEPPVLKAESVSVYGGSNFSLVLAQKIGLELISPADDSLLKFDPKWLKREILCKSLSEISALKYPVFAKPFVPKVFRAAIFTSFEQLENECTGLASDTKLLVSEIVKFENEARSFVEQGTLLDCQIYEGNGRLEDASAFLRDFIKSESLPTTCVVDVGFISGRGWAVVELNASWGAGLNGCDARRVLPAIASATKAGFHPKNC